MPQQPRVIYVQAPPQQGGCARAALLLLLLPFIVCGGCLMLGTFRSVVQPPGIGSADGPAETPKAPARIPFTDEEKLAIIGFIQPSHGVEDLQPGVPNKLYVTILFQQLPATEKERVCDALTRAALDIREDEPRTSEGMMYIYDNRDRKYIGQYDRARGVRMN